jgi:hypothetical protein
MATIEARGYVNKLERKESAKGPYVKFDLAVQQKRKDRTGTEVKETLYFKCIDFDPKEAPDDGEYVGVTGYVTLTKWDGGKDGKGGVNIDVTVKSYEKLAQREDTRKPKAPTADAPPADPFAIEKDKP